MARGGPVSVEFLFEGCDVIHKCKYEYVYDKYSLIEIIPIRVPEGHIDLSEPSLPGRHKSRSTAVSLRGFDGLIQVSLLSLITNSLFTRHFSIRSHHHVLSLDFTHSTDAVVRAEIAVKATRILSIAIQFEFTEQKVDRRIAPDEGGLSHSQTET